jgi:hypothetical protein
VENKGERSCRVRVIGKAEMKALADEVFCALENASLTEELLLLQERVFSSSPEALFETTSVADESQWAVKPMVELLLLHVQDAAASDSPVKDRQQEIRWAVDAAGF